VVDVCLKTDPTGAGLDTGGVCCAKYRHQIARWRVFRAPAELSPSCRTEVSAEGLSAREEEYIGYYVRESAHYVGVQFDLPKSGLDIIGVHRNVG